jgi:DNA (cytosine-5)-methyltransferase 1
MKYLSLCSGIEAATVAWHPLGWEAVAYSEIERFPSEVLAHHYPSTPNLGDMTKFKEWTNVSNVDLLVGGTPCQSFSVAGLRKGLDDPRGNLMLTYLAIADKFKPQWLVWENVPGVLSSNGGKDFGVFLGALGELGYGFAYRILDAQYFGVAQRRRRVFVVGYLGDWRAAAAVLFERHSLQGHPAPSREKGKDTSATITARTGVSRNNHEECVTSALKGFHETGFAQYQKANVGGTIKASGGVLGGGSETFLVHPIPLNTMTMQGRPSDDGRMGSGIGEPGDPAPTLTKAHSHAVAQPIAFSGQMSNPQTDVDMTQTLQAKNPMAVAVGTDLYNGNITGDVAATMGTPGSSINASGPTVMQAVAFSAGNSSESRSIGYTVEGTPPLRAGASGTNQVPTLMQAMAVRRLTPVECERLQGFPDSYTDIKSKGKPTPDGPRYKALGNSMAVPVMAWIGQRIEQVEAICKQNK